MENLEHAFIDCKPIGSKYDEETCIRSRGNPRKIRISNATGCVIDTKIIDIETGQDLAADCFRLVIDAADGVLKASIHMFERDEKGIVIVKGFDTPGAALATRIETAEVVELDAVVLN